MEIQSNNQSDMSNEARIANPVEVERYLKVVDYPANKESQIRYVMDKSAQVISTLKKMEDKIYNSPIEISKEIGKIK